MAEIIPLDRLAEEGPDQGEMDRAALLERLETLRRQISALDLEEPEDMESEEYEAWGDHREVLEDLVDDILDLLDEN